MQSLNFFFLFLSFFGIFQPIFVQILNQFHEIYLFAYELKAIIYPVLFILILALRKHFEL